MTTRAHLSLMAVVVVWAGSFPVIKALLDDGVAAGDIAILRYAIAAPGFALILWRARGLPGISRGDAVRVAVAGVLVVVGYHVSLNVGTRHTTSGIAALVVALAPGMTIVLAFALGLDRIRPRQVIGLTVALVGVAIVVALGSGSEQSLETVKGPLIVLGAPLSFALYNVIMKPLLGRHDLLALTAATSLVGIVGLTPFVRGSTIETIGGPSVEEAVLLLYLGVLATLLGYIAWNIGLRGLGPTRAVVYTYAISPLAVTFGAVTLGETVTLWLVIGGGLVVGGIATAQGVSLARRRAKRQASFGHERAHGHGIADTRTWSLIDPDAFVEIFDRHFDAIHRYLHRRVGRDLADELAAEMFTHAYRRRSAFEPRLVSAQYEFVANDASSRHLLELDTKPGARVVVHPVGEGPQG